METAAPEGTYVYEGTEVKKTGRTAIKTLKARLKTKEMLIVEIAPIDNSFDWKKWVRPEDLYEVSK